MITKTEMPSQHTRKYCYLTLAMYKQ